VSSTDLAVASGQAKIAAGRHCEVRKIYLAPRRVLHCAELAIMALENLIKDYELKFKVRDQEIP
jgi:hypothetical protein